MNLREGTEAWEVQFSIAPIDPAKSWRQNLAAMVLAGDAEDAMSAVRKVYPDANIHSINKRTHQYSRRVILIHEEAIES